MADPFSIIGVIGVAGQIANAAIKLGLDWRDAPQEVRNFMDELDSLKTILSETNTNIILNQDFKDAFEGRHSTLLSHLQATPAGVATTILLSSCQDELKDLLKKLEKTSLGHRVGWRRAKEAFLSDRTHGAVVDLQRRCEMLNRMVSIDSAALGANTNLEIRATRKELQQKHMDEHDKMVIDWLSPIDVTAQLSDNLERREAGTGQWLLDSTKFQTWLQTRGQKLFCPGLPGAGKTILTSIVIEHLHDRFRDDHAIGIAYIFCNFRRKEEQHLGNLLSILLRQLCQGRPTLPEEVRQLYDDHKRKGTRPSRDETIRMLRTVTAIYTKTYILIDALDECENDESCRDRLIAEMNSLSSICNVNIFATSRDIPDITSQFEDDVQLEIRASDDDVKRYLDNQMLKLPASVKNNTELKDEIKAKVIECAQGMFLLARLHLLSLIGKRSAKAVRTALAKLSAGSDAYDTAYEEAMERIEGQLKDQVTLAKDALSWIVCSKRPLSTVELQEALAVETGTTELDLDNLPDIGDVISVCAGLVTVDEESHVIRLVHYTTQEYFERTKARWLPEAEALVTASCVTYLCFDNFNSGPCESHRKLMSRLRNNPLYEYAAQNWGHHARATRPLCGEVIDFLQNQMNLNASFEVLWTQELAKRDADLEWYTYDLPRKLSGLHLAAHFGIEEFLDIMMGRPSTDAERVNPCLVDHMHNPQKLDFNAQDSLGQTPLFYSVSSNMEGFTKALLELGSVEFDKKSRHGRTPLCIAAKYGYGAIVKWLVTKFADKIDIDSKDEYDQTPLSYAAERGHVAVLRCLLETGKVDIDSKDNIGQTSLSLAALAGNEAIARCLLETGKAEVNSKDKYGRTPLSHAAERGHIDFVKCLLEIGKIEVDLKDDAGRTPLSYAAENDNEAVVRCLLETSKVDVDLSDANSRTPFLWAVENGKEATARCLLNTGKVDINSRNGHGRTPLANAVLAGNEAIARFLIETDRAEVNLKDNHGQTPLSVAAERGRVDIVKSLLASGKVHVNSENDLGRTPLSYAAEMGRDAIVRLLLQTGKVEVDLREKHGQTPLYYAAKKGYTAIARCLLETGEADVNLKNKSGRTPLSIAAEWGHEDTVSYLLGLDNCKVDAKDEEGKTPLIYAIINSHEDTALRLLETGQVDVNARSEQGKAPLHYAIDHCLATHDDTLEGADTSVVELLIEVGGADPNVRDCEGQTVLWLAISYGLEELTEYLVSTGKIDGLLNMRDEKGRTPMDVVHLGPESKRRLREVTPYLVELYWSLETMKPTE